MKTYVECDRLAGLSVQTKDQGRVYFVESKEPVEAKPE